MPSGIEDKYVFCEGKKYLDGFSHLPVKQSWPHSSFWFPVNFKTRLFYCLNLLQALLLAIEEPAQAPWSLKLLQELAGTGEISESQVGLYATSQLLDHSAVLKRFIWCCFGWKRFI